MFSDDTRRKIENIIRGVSIEGQTDHCTATRNFLCESFSTSTTVKRNFEGQLIIKEDQASRLRDYAMAQSLWISSFPGKDRFLAKGGESQVFLDKDEKNVIKVNDAIYYATWLEYLIVLFFTMQFLRTRHISF